MLMGKSFRIELITDGNVAVLNYRFELQVVKPTAHQLSSSSQLVPRGHGAQPEDNKPHEVRRSSRCA